MLHALATLFGALVAVGAIAAFGIVMIAVVLAEIEGEED